MKVTFAQRAAIYYVMDTKFWGIKRPEVNIIMFNLKNGTLTGIQEKLKSEDEKPLFSY